MRENFRERWKGRTSTQSEETGGVEVIRIGVKANQGRALESTTLGFDLRACCNFGRIPDCCETVCIASQFC